jgi:predicted Zn-ribbon and HTH transcriptional regulator
MLLKESPIELFRCIQCQYLMTDRHIKKHGCCPKCGSRKVSGAFPKNFFETLKCNWWSLFLK